MHDNIIIYLDEVEKFKELNRYQNLLVLLSKRGYAMAKVKLGQSRQELVLNIALEFLGQEEKFEKIIADANVGLKQAIDNIELYEGENLDEYLRSYITASIKEGMHL